jgi:hypothetical protein
MPVDHSQMKLGKKPPRFDDRTLKLSKYLTPDLLPKQPKSFSWYEGISDWKMMMNDTVGCCTISAAGHIQMGVTYANNRIFIPNDDQIIADYARVTKYTPGHPETDNGAVCLDILKEWRKVGFSGRRIGGFASVDIFNQDFVEKAIYLFGDLYLGVGLCIANQTQDVWDVPPGGPVGDGTKYSWGGHAIPLTKYNPSRMNCITWGDNKEMTWPFFNTYVDEAYVIFSEDFLTNGISPNGFDRATLLKDLDLITG